MNLIRFLRELYKHNEILIPLNNDEKIYLNKKSNFIENNTRKTRLVISENGRDTEIILEGNGKLKVAVEV